jgi:hypothetical protein
MLMMAGIWVGAWLVRIFPEKSDFNFAAGATGLMAFIFGAMIIVVNALDD